MSEVEISGVRMIASDQVVVVESTMAFEQFVAAEQRGLQRFAFLMIGNREDARDAVQDALVGAYRRWDRVGGDPGKYVRRSIVNAHISAWRKKHREIPTSAVTDGGVEPPGVNTVWVQEMCRTLPRKQRAALVLRYFEDETFADIGAMLGCSDATARSLVSRAVASLRHHNQED